MHSLIQLLKIDDRIYSFISSAYHKTPQYQKLLRQKLIKGQTSKKLIKKYLDNKFIINSGPFKNLKYLSNPGIGSLLPKIIGSYENPIHAWINETFDEKYQKIINLGSAEGYYAVGFAVKLPKSNVIASDTSLDAQKMCRELARINKVKNLVVSGRIDSETLNHEVVKNRTLVLCDIEGGEYEILDPLATPKLLNSDIICELHDHLVFKNITRKLMERFYDTHKIEIEVDNKKDLEKYTALLKLPKNLRKFAVNESRSGITKWMRLLKRRE